MATASSEAVQRLVLTLADTKRILGIRYSDWLLGAPSIEMGIAASSMCQDEWGHARLLYAMLKEFGRDPRTIEHERPPEAYTSADPLDRPFDTWAEFVAATVLVDGAATTALEGFGEGGFELARTRVPKMLAEERFHEDLGAAWFRRLADGSPAARQALLDTVERMLPRTLAWLAPVDEQQVRLAADGLTDDARTLLARYIERVQPVLAALDLEIDPDGAERQGWDPVRGRGPGQPDMDAIERARGDRNRALFVE